MGKSTPRTFEQVFKSFRSNHQPYALFSDFCTMAAASLANVTRSFQTPEAVERREKEYAQCVQRYDAEELSKLAQLLGIVTASLEENPDQDVLGPVFINLGFANARAGQFFTPYHVGRCMAEMNMAGVGEKLKEQPYITIQDPCVGGGSMLIAAFNAARAAGVNPQTQCRFYGGDIDGVVLRMAYIQCSLLGMCGHFIHGNSLALETWDSFITPFLHLNAWRFPAPETVGEPHAV
jgi:type I restriction-modification system DNA methylase subunit